MLDYEPVHVRRKDALGRVLFAIAAPVLWAHPLYWWLRRRAMLAAELIAADAAATGDRAAYARALVGLAREIHSPHPAPGIVPGAFRNRSELTRRVQMLMEESGGLATTCTPRRRVAQAVAGLIGVGLCGALLGARPDAEFQIRIGRWVRGGGGRGRGWRGRRGSG